MSRFEASNSHEQSAKKESMTILDRIKSKLDKKTLILVMSALTAGNAAIACAEKHPSHKDEPSWVNQLVNKQIKGIKESTDELTTAITTPIEVVAFPIQLAQESANLHNEQSIDAEDEESTTKNKQYNFNIQDWDKSFGGDPFSEEYQQREQEIKNQREKFIKQSSAELTDKLFENLKNSTVDELKINEEARERCKFINNEQGREDCISQLSKAGRDDLQEKLMALSLEEPDTAYAIANKFFDTQKDSLNVALRSSKPELLMDWMFKQGVSKDHIAETETSKINLVFSNDERLNDLTVVFPDMPLPYRVYIQKALQEKVDYYSEKTSGANNPTGKENETNPMHEMEKYQMYLDAISGYEENY